MMNSKTNPCSETMCLGLLFMVYVILYIIFKVMPKITILEMWQQKSGNNVTYNQSYFIDFSLLFIRIRDNVCKISDM